MRGKADETFVIVETLICLLQIFHRSYNSDFIHACERACWRSSSRYTLLNVTYGKKISFLKLKTQNNWLEVVIRFFAFHHLPVNVLIFRALL